MLAGSHVPRPAGGTLRAPRAYAESGARAGFRAVGVSPAINNGCAPRPPRAAGASPPRATTACVVAALLVLLIADPAWAYIGPGAGFAVGSTLVAFFLAFLSGLAAILFWPFRWLVRFIRGRHALANARVKRFVILGLDGMEPSLAEKYMAEGRMPNLARLKEEGCFRRLGTTAPPLSPVAWSTFLTGCNPGKHNIFDFLTRDKRSYLPLLSSVAIHEPLRTLKIGKRRIPLGKADIRLLRKGRPFWNVLGEHGIFSNVIRVPITFPPERFRGVLLSAMCVPDLRGSQGTFSYYSTRVGGEEHIGGEQIRVDRQGDLIRSHLVGPENALVEGAGPMRCPFEVRITGAGQATLKVDGHSVPLRQGEYTPWVNVTFRAGLGIKVRGICEFLLQATHPEFELYVTPVQIDPSRPAMPISHPTVYSTYLAKNQGTYATLGLAEDTWGLNARILGDDDFLHQCLEADAERERMFFDALEKVRRGLCVCVFDGTDRIQHMFWRYIDPQHPAHAGQAQPQHREAIAELYARMDALVGRTMKECRGRDTVLMVISDHGFNPFRRGVDWNVWLEQNGYLTLTPDGRGKKYLSGVDWSRTKAYCLGLAGIWLNIKGREAKGIVEPGEADALREELCAKMTGLRDEERGETAVTRALNAHKIYKGPYRAEGPDIIVGYNRGYRVSWEAAIGQPTECLFHDNDKAWSGDHCIDPQHIPGVLFCNRKIAEVAPRLMDLGPTVLELFGVPVPGNMDGKPLTVADANGTFPGGNPSGEPALPATKQVAA
ncbi:MAG: alkaline phosphatase family protein [Planctomycetes bacterium]|nr:alkaline phosphatase family protein [Planctomycetota bacterium]